MVWAVSLRECLLFIAILWGVSVTVITEILSAFSLITPGWLVVFWCVVFLGATCFVVTLMKRQRLVILSPPLRFPFRAVPFLHWCGLIGGHVTVTYCAILPPSSAYLTQAESSPRQKPPSLTRSADEVIE
jgi:hypothetical protein